MNKFQHMLSASSKEIKGTRAKLLAEDVKFSQEELLRNLTAKKRGLERKLNALTDLYPDSELTLMVVKKDLNPNEWTKQIQDVKIELANVTIEVELATETYTEWFGELAKED